MQIHLGMDVRQIALRDTREHLGGFRGSNIQKSWKAVKRLDRLASTLVHVCGFMWEWAYAKYKSPLNTPRGMSGGGGGVRGSHIQKSGEAVCGIIWEWT